MARELTPEEFQQVRPIGQGTVLRARELTPQELSAVRKEPQPGAWQRIGEGLNNLLTQFNTGIAESVGLPGIAPGTPTAPATMSQGASRMMGQAAGTTAGMLAAAPALAGATAARLVPGAAAEVAPGAGAAISRFASEAAQTAMARPGAFWSLEMIPAAAAGAAGQRVRETTGSPTSALVAELGAGTAAGIAAPLAGAYLRVAPVVSIASQLGNAVLRPHEASRVGRNRAARSLQQRIPGASEVIARADAARERVLPEAPLTLGELAESQELLSLQRSVADATDQLSIQNQERFADINDVAQGALRNLGGAENRIASVEESRAFLNTLVEERIRLARAAVDEELEGLGPRATRQDSNVRARARLDKAYADVLKQEEELWSGMDLEVLSGHDSLADAYQSLLKETSTDRVALLRDLVPGKLRKFLGSVDKDGNLISAFDEEPPTAREMVSMRQELLDMAQRERAKDAPNRRKIRAATILQEAILNDLSQLGGLSEQFDVARAFSRDLNQRFRQGEVGTIMGFDIDGGRSVPPLLTLESTLGLSGPRGAAGAGALLEAVQRTGGTDEMRGYMENFLRDEFMQATRSYGEFDASKAANYMAQRRDVLQLFPELRRDMDRATTAGDTFDVTSKMGEKKKVSAAALVLQAAPGREMERIVGSQHPQRAAKEIMGLLDSDRSGIARAGMKNAAADWLLSKSVSTGAAGAADVRDVSFFSGRLLEQQLGNPAIRGALGEIFSPEELKRLDQIAETGRRLDLSRAARPSQQGVIGDKEAMLFNIARRLSAAAIGSRVAGATGSGGNIQIPSMVIQASNKMRERGLDPARDLIISAVTDPSDKLLRTLLMEPPGPGDSRRTDLINRQLNAWALQAAAQYGLDLSGADEGRTPSFHPSDLPQVPAR